MTARLARFVLFKLRHRALRRRGGLPAYQPFCQMSFLQLAQTFVCYSHN